MGTRTDLFGGALIQVAIEPAVNPTDQRTQSFCLIVAHDYAKAGVIMPVPDTTEIAAGYLAPWKLQ